MNRSQHAIVVTGASGQQGGAAARHLLADGWHVRAFVRDPEKPASRSLAEQGATLVRGDLDDPASIAEAVRGAYGVFSVQSWASGVDAERRQGMAVADAALDAGVEHFVYSSVGGAERSTGIPHFESKWSIEEHVRDIGLSYTIWRPVSFMENLLRQLDAICAGRYTPSMNPDVAQQLISVDDIGAFVALSFRAPGAWLGHATEIAGDELSSLQVAEVLSRVLALQVEVVPQSRPTDPDRAAMVDWMERDGYDADIPKLRRVLPSLHDFPQWASARIVCASETGVPA